jgi:hypothetical protein
MEGVWCYFCLFFLSLNAHLNPVGVLQEERERAAAAEGATVNPMIAALEEHAAMMEIEELARRTGRRKQDLVHAPLGGHFRSASTAGDAIV